MWWPLWLCTEWHIASSRLVTDAAPIDPRLAIRSHSFQIHCIVATYVGVFAWHFRQKKASVCPWTQNLHDLTLEVTDVTRSAPSHDLSKRLSKLRITNIRSQRSANGWTPRIYSDNATWILYNDVLTHHSRSSPHLKQACKTIPRLVTFSEHCTTLAQASWPQVIKMTTCGLQWWEQ